MGDWYVYRHIRLDKNIPFYIGIGSRDKYKRAYERGRNMRSDYWNKIVRKTDYEVEILLSNLSKKDAIAKEIEFISLYRRTIDGGSLCNLTLGGEGSNGHKMSEVTKSKISQKNKGKIVSIETIDKIRKSLALSIDDDYRAKSSKGRLGKKITEEHKIKIMMANSGKPKSEETKQRISLSQKGRQLTDEHKQKLSKAKIGVKQSQSSIMKRAESLRGRIGNKHSDSTKEKLRLANLGNKHSEETKLKMSTARKGKKMSDETKRKMSEMALVREEKKRLLSNQKKITNA